MEHEAFFCTEHSQILDNTEQNLPGATWLPGFEHHWCKVYCILLQSVLRNLSDYGAKIRLAKASSPRKVRLPRDLDKVV